MPYIDELDTAVDAGRDQTWSALLHVLRASLGGAERGARLLGCEPARATPGFTGREGQTLPGFRVVEAEPGRRLALHGRHRFAHYQLTFLLDDDRLRARTHAAFPGLHGRIYRAAVIATGGHVLATRWILRRVARRAGRSGQ